MGDKKYRDKHRELGLCIECSNPVWNGRARCINHLESSRIRSLTYRKRHPERSRETQRKKKEKYKLQNRCPDCGRPLLAEDLSLGYICCEDCRARKGVMA